MSGGTVEYIAIVGAALVIGLPFALTFAYMVCRLWLRNRQVEMILAERKLLIEKGITDLPPLEVPNGERKASPVRNLAAGLILLFIAAALALDYGLRPHEPFMGSFQQSAVLITGAVGIALVTIHFIARAYLRGESRSEVLANSEAGADAPSEGE